MSRWKRIIELSQAWSTESRNCSGNGASGGETELEASALDAIAIMAERNTKLLYIMQIVVRVVRKLNLVRVRHKRNGW